MNYQRVFIIHFTDLIYINIPQFIQIIAGFVFIICLLRILLKWYSSKTSVIIITGLLIIFIGTSKFAYCFSSQINYSLSDRIFFLFSLNNGYLWYAGFIAIILYLSYIFYITKKPVLLQLDLIAYICGIWIFMDPFSCFFNNCCYGYGSILPWAINVNGIMRHPAQLYLSMVGMFYVLLSNILLINKIKVGQLFITLSLFGTVGEFIVELITVRNNKFSYFSDTHFYIFLGLAIVILVSLKIQLPSSDTKYLYLKKHYIVLQFILMFLSIISSLFIFTYKWAIVTYIVFYLISVLLFYIIFNRLLKNV